MTTNNSMTVITSKPFGALNVDVYQNDKHQYYMTREQIGRALECKEPRKYIAKIHERNADRLDPLSSVVNLTTEVGNYTQERKTYMYSLRGVMEICRLSRQPKADAFMDFCWDIMESLMRGDSVLATPQMDAALSKEFIDVRLHALFDSMKNLQSELDSTRKDLSDQIEEARATSNEALNVISSVSQCVHQIKDKQMDDAIRSTRNFTPRKDVMSDWRKKMYERIQNDIIAYVKEVTPQFSVMQIYSDDRAGVNTAITNYLNEKLTAEYGINVSSALIVDAQPDDTLMQKIRAKEQAKQDAEIAELNKQTALAQAETDKVKAQTEADVKMIEAQAEADANKVLSESITPELIQMKEAEARLKHGWVTVQGADTVVTKGE